MALPLADRASRPLEGPAVALVGQPADYAEAQRRLTGFVRPFRAHSDPGAVQDRPGLRTARALAVGQAALQATAAAWAEQVGRDDLAREFRARVPLYRALHASTVRLVDTIPGRSTLAVVQQSEMARQLRIGHRKGPGEEALVELNEVSHHLTVALGKALRREGMATGHIQTWGTSEVGLPRPTPMTNSRHPFYVACKALADSPPPSSVSPAPTPDRTQRRRLQAQVQRASLRRGAWISAASAPHGA